VDLLQKQLDGPGGGWAESADPEVFEVIEDAIEQLKATRKFLERKKASQRYLVRVPDGIVLDQGASSGIRAFTSLRPGGGRVSAKPFNPVGKSSTEEPLPIMAADVKTRNYNTSSKLGTVMKSTRDIERDGRAFNT